MALRIIVTGLVGQYPFGGVAWDYLQYVEGFRQLGHDVYYLEDTGAWPYDPNQKTVTTDCTYTINYLQCITKKLGLQNRWIYRNGINGSYYGYSESETNDLCKSADVLVNVSGWTWLRPVYAKIPNKIFIDTDPLFSQIEMLADDGHRLHNVRAHDYHFTFAENIGKPDCLVPMLDINWISTRSPIVLDWWTPSPVGNRDVFTTVMNWASYKECKFKGQTWGQKNTEFLKFIELPQICSQNLEIAMEKGQGMSRPTALLQSKGWNLVEPSSHLPDPFTYREYLNTSKGEWSIAKEGYVKSISGWFSCRSGCYLALGKPCVLQDTGWSKFYPTGNGLFAFSRIEDMRTIFRSINSDYSSHSIAARRIAETHFDAREVLNKMLKAIGLT